VIEGDISTNVRESTSQSRFSRRMKKKMVVLVDGFISVQDGFIVGLLDGVEGTRSFVGFISSTDVKKDTYERRFYKLCFQRTLTHIDDVGEDLRFGKDGDSVFELSDFVIRGSILSVLDFMVLALVRYAQ